MPPQDHGADVHDIVGIGFGPSDLALAVSSCEYNDGAPESERLTAAFVERQRAFSRHRDLCRPDRYVRAVCGGRPLVDIAYRVRGAAGEGACGDLCPQGDTEHAYPITGPFPSLSAARAGEVPDSVLASLRAPASDR